MQQKGLVKTRLVGYIAQLEAPSSLVGLPGFKPGVGR